MQVCFTDEPIWFTMTEPFLNVVGLRQPLEGSATKKSIFMDRGRVEFQKFGTSDSKFRILCFERNTGDLLLTLPVDYIAFGAGTHVKTKNNKLKKTKITLMLNTHLNTNVDGLESILFKMNRDEANRLADILLPSWKIMKGII
jgi:hypothetical protein